MWLASDYYTVAQAAEVLGVTEQTIERWRMVDPLGFGRPPGTNLPLLLREDVEVLKVEREARNKEHGAPYGAGPAAAKWLAHRPFTGRVAYSFPTTTTTIDMRRLPWADAITSIVVEPGRLILGYEL